MKKFLFTTVTTIKDNNYWIDSDFCKSETIQANNVEEALDIYLNNRKDNDYINISKNAIKNKQPMYIDDDIQCGYVIVGSTLVENKEGNWVKKYIELWIEIKEVINPFIKE